MGAENDDAPEDQSGDAKQHNQGDSSTGYRRKPIGFFAMISSDILSNSKIVAAGPHGTLTYLHALCRNAARERTGVLPAADFAPAYLARMIGISQPEATAALTACVDVGLLDRAADEIHIVGWSEAWKRGPLTEAERVRKATYRSKKRSETRPEKRSEERESRGNGTRPGQVPDKRPHPLPDGWGTEGALDRWGDRFNTEFRDVDLSHETSRFIAKAKAEGWLKADWDAAFDAWILNAAKWAREKRTKRGPTQIALDELRRIELAESDPPLFTLNKKTTETASDSPEYGAEETSIGDSE